MKKVEQININELCEREWQKAMKEFLNCPKYLSVNKLRHCQAIVYETNNYYILASYITPVAILSKEDNHLYDLLRRVYGYKATSAKHIAKFYKDYVDTNHYSCKFTWKSIT